MIAIARIYKLRTAGLTMAAAAIIAAGESAPARGLRGTEASVPVGVRMAADGRAHEIIADGTLAHLRATRASRVSVLLQQLLQRHGRSLWSTRARGRVASSTHHPRFRLRWRHPPTNRSLELRVIVLAHGHLLARSASVQVTAGDPGTVFYSGEGDAGAGDVTHSAIRLVASFQLLGLGPHFDGKWTGSHECETSNAVPAQSSIGSEPITELAGFSLGRLGPIYFLLRNPSWAPQISYILLFDPGNESDMSKCDTHGDIAPATTLASWLGARAANRVVIIAGTRTAEHNYAGLTKYYLGRLTPSEQQQVLICQASPAHDAFLETPRGGFGWMVSAPAPTSCPTGSRERTGWRAPVGSSSAPLTPPAPPAVTPPQALPAGEFYVMNAAGGIYWRSAPDWNTPEAAPGNGFYPGTIIKIACYQAGAANVPGSADGMWEQATWVSGTGSGSGWINEHFIADSAAINQSSPGAPPCSNSPPPPPRPPPPQPPPAMSLEQETPNHPVNTFADYHNASGMGPQIASGQWVEVSCKVYDPTIGSVNPDGYWYRVASSPWSNSYYSPANTFMNGDPYGGPYTHNTDFAVPNC